MKKKLEQSYTPDKSGQKGRVVVGLSGGLDSYVVAYLLKIQKYEILGVTVAINWEQFEGEQTKMLSCHAGHERLLKIKQFCQALKIPHTVINANEIFQEQVVEGWMGAKALGMVPNPCWTCHDLRMHLLHQKMLEVEATSFATGHFAKLFHHEAHDTYYVHTSNDEEYDQSALLSRLPREVLKSLKLPLSDLQKKEVIKLAENFGLTVKSGALKMHDCFPSTTASLEYLTKHIPPKLVVEGELTNSDGSENFGEHLGVHHYDLGQSIEVMGPGNEKIFFTRYSFKEKKIVLSDEDYFKQDQIMLVNCHFSEETSKLEPMNGCVIFGSGLFTDCWIHPKSLNAIHLKWEGHFSVKEGEILRVLKKKGKNSKIYFTGEARYIKRPGESYKKSEKGDKIVELDHSRDF